MNDKEQNQKAVSSPNTLNPPPYEDFALIKLLQKVNFFHTSGDARKLYNLNLFFSTYMLLYMVADCCGVESYQF